MNTGISTRKIDNAVQDLFNKGIAYLYDGRHNNQEKHIILLTKFINRMSLEHPKTEYHYDYNKWDGVWCYKIKIAYL